MRRTVYNSFRALDSRAVEEGAWPWLYGDAFGYTNPDPTAPPSPKKYLQLPPFRTYAMECWVQGDFVDDYSPVPPFRNDLSYVGRIELRPGAPPELTVIPTRLEHDEGHFVRVLAPGDPDHATVAHSASSNVMW